MATGQKTVADHLLQALDEAGVDYIFAVLGSDHPSIIEAYAWRQRNGLQKPSMLLFQHEFVAISAADGYARATGRAQCVLVHVDVGTSALGQGLHTASSGKAPMLIIAGHAPSTLHGELPGSRSEHVQWYQDVPNQAAIVAPFARYTNEIKTGHHVSIMVNRAILMASTGPCGPSYLTATREVLASPCEVSDKAPPRNVQPSYKLGGLPEDAAEIIADALLKAEKPLVVTGYLGRNHAAVQELSRLADLVKGVKVFDFEAREMSFPASHPAWVTRATGAAPAIRQADVILVLDADVPWIPTKVHPNANCRIFHVDSDPRKEYMQLFDIFAEATFHAECELALRQLNKTIESRPSFVDFEAQHSARWSSLLESYKAGLQTLATRAAPVANELITINSLGAMLRETLPGDTTYVHDVVTNQVPLTEQLQLSVPGTNFSKGSSGLGWAPGAAIGVRLALDRYALADRPRLERAGKEGQDRLVCAVTGDGAFVFGAPSAVYWAQHKHSTPFLTVVVNNGGWKATRACLNDVHAEGIAQGMTDDELGINLRADGPDYVGIAVAASNGNIWGRRVQRASEVKSALQEAVEVVQGLKGPKRGALLEIIIV